MAKEKVEVKEPAPIPPVLKIAGLVCELQLCETGYPSGANYGFMLLGNHPNEPVWKYTHPTNVNTGVTIFMNANSRVDINKVKGRGELSLHNSVIDSPLGELTVNSNDNGMVNSSIRDADNIRLREAILVKSMFTIGHELNLTDTSCRDSQVSARTVWLTGSMFDDVSIDNEQNATLRVVVNNTIVADAHLDNVSNIEISDVLRVAHLNHYGDGNKVQIFHRAHYGKFNPMCGEVHYVHSGEGAINIGGYRFTQTEILGGYNNDDAGRRVYPSDLSDQAFCRKLLSALGENYADEDNVITKLSEIQIDNLTGVYYQMKSRMAVFNLLNII